MDLKQAHNGHHAPYFSQTAAFVLACPDRHGKVNVAARETSQGPAVVCFLSRAQAAIEAERRRRRGQCFDVVHAGQVDPQVFRAASTQGLVAEMQLAWPACDGRIVVMPENSSAAVARLMHHWAVSGEPLDVFEVDDLVLAQLDQLYERAGLFAWRETHRDLLAWDEARLRELVGRAFTTVEFVEGDLAQCGEAALFDPEAGRWHFVSIDGLVCR